MSIHLGQLINNGQVDFKYLLTKRSLLSFIRVAADEIDIDCMLADGLGAI